MTRLIVYNMNFKNVKEKLESTVKVNKKKEHSRIFFKEK